jgi:L-alanine-DL-glutamate epimerase-like enolase superfamily enzyme
MTQMDSDIQVKEIELMYEPQRARFPLKFGAVVMTHVTLCKVRAIVENRAGKCGEGWGAMFLADFWAWPRADIEHELKEAVMKRTAEGYAELVSDYEEPAHPVDIFWQLEGELRKLSDQVSRDAGTPEPQPFLGALVAASPVDAALHDAFGVANGIDVYRGYGPEFMGDLSRYLGPEFKNRYVADYLRPEYRPEIEVFHLVGGLDKLTRAELDETDPDDGVPNCLEDYIARDGVFCLKVKLRGNDLDWDVDRCLAVHQVGKQGLERLGITELHMTADTNEQCESPDYIMEMLARIKEKSPECFEQILYIEQPTGRDLAAEGHDMRELASIKPVLVDESLTDLESFNLAMEQGWSGIALKACKCQSSAIVMAAKARAMGIPYAVQDLTNPSLALFHSVGMAARMYTIMGVEANSRQFFPAATSVAERTIHSGIFYVRRGYANTWSLQGPGLGFQMARIRALEREM